MNELGKANEVDQVSISMYDIRMHFAEFLDLDEPVSEQVIQAAINNPLYRHHLFACRNTPEFLERLISNPPVSEKSLSSNLYHQSNSEIIAKGIKTLLNWSKVGFSVVDNETYEKRFSCCIQCPNLVEAPDRLIYRIISAKTVDSRICNVCGCVASKKASLPLESCPDKHPEYPHLNRWGELLS
jgi:hypothetical protein